MIRKSGYWFSEKIMLQRINLEHDPIQPDRIMPWGARYLTFM